VNGTTDWHEQHLYLQQPAYGTSYIIGKVQVEQMMADRARQWAISSRSALHGRVQMQSGLIPRRLCVGTYR